MSLIGSPAAPGTIASAKITSILEFARTLNARELLLLNGLLTRKQRLKSLLNAVVKETLLTYPQTPSLMAMLMAMTMTILVAMTMMMAMLMLRRRLNLLYRLVVT
jgi:hypothetical protein